MVRIREVASARVMMCFGGVLVVVSVGEGNVLWQRFRTARVVVLRMLVSSSSVVKVCVKEGGDALPRAHQIKVPVFSRLGPRGEKREREQGLSGVRHWESVEMGSIGASRA